jgi:hypothetical protein
LLRQKYERNINALKQTKAEKKAAAELQEK